MVKLKFQTWRKFLNLIFYLKIKIFVRKNNKKNYVVCNLRYISNFINY